MRAIIVSALIIAVIAIFSHSSQPQTVRLSQAQVYNSACLDYAVTGCPLAR